MSAARTILKIALIIVGLFLVAIAAFVVWFIRHPIVFTAPITTKLIATASRDDAGHAIRCTLRFTGSDKPHTVTEIKMPREWVQALGASPPSGFTEQPLVAEKKTDDQAFIEKFNREAVRWVGHLAVPRDEEIVVSIPAQQPRAGSGTIRFQYEYRGKLGGSIQFAQVTVENP
jgi:hypothetical protein